MLTKERREVIRVDVSRALTVSRAVLDGHFIGKSGLHLSRYVNKDRLFTSPKAVNLITKCFSELIEGNGGDVEVVAGPSIGGVILAHKTAEHLSVQSGREITSVFTEKEQIVRNGTVIEVQKLKRGYDTDVRNRLVVVVEDVLTTGGSLREVIKAISEAGGIIAGAYAIVNRDPKNITPATFEAPFDALVDMPLESYEEDKVPEWLAKIPINTTIGHGAKYLKERQK